MPKSGRGGWLKSAYARIAILASSFWLGWSAMRTTSDADDVESRVRKARLTEGWRLNGDELRAASLWLGQGLGPCLVQAHYAPALNGARLGPVLRLSVRALPKGTRIDSRLAADADLDKVAHLPRARTVLTRAVRSGLPQAATARKRAA